jgi:predicted P-loop ATPase
LTDPSGNRRWAPIRVAMTSEFIDHPKFKNERDQYWAEAKALTEQFPTAAAAIEHYSTALRNLAGPAIADATVLDAWHSDVEAFVLAQSPGTKVKLLAIFGHLFSSGLSAMDHTRVNRIRNIMTVLKLEEVGTDVWVVPAREFSL